MKTRCIILLIISIFAFSILFISEINAYSTSDYSINILPGFSQSGNSFSDNNGNSFNVNTSYVGYFEDLKYDKRNLDLIANALQEYGKNFLISTLHNYVRTNYGKYYYEIQNHLNLLDYNYDILNKDIVKFSDNNYKGFYIKSQMSIEDLRWYAEQYCVYSNGYQYVLTLSSFDNSYFDSSEAKNIIDSFTIRNFNPIDTSPLLPFSNGLSIIAIIVIVIFVILYIMKKKEYRKTANYLNSYKDYNVENINNPYKKKTEEKY